MYIACIKITVLMNSRFMLVFWKLFQIHSIFLFIILHTSLGHKFAHFTKIWTKSRVHFGNYTWITAPWWFSSFTPLLNQYFWRQYLIHLVWILLDYTLAKIFRKLFLVQLEKIFIVFYFYFCSYLKILSCPNNLKTKF